jgi:hypothetical protein
MSLVTRAERRETIVLSRAMQAMGETATRATPTTVEGLLLGGDGVVAGRVGDGRDSNRASDSDETLENES